MFHGQGQQFIGGEFCQGQGQDWISVYNPADLQLVGEFRGACERDALLAVEAAQKAIPCWRQQSAQRRAEYLQAIGDALLAQQQEIGLAIATENGKNLKEAQAEIAYAASYFHYYARYTSSEQAVVIEQEASEQWSVYYQPIGLVALVTPWNFPLAMLARKLAMVIATACVAVAKPDPLCPSAALYLARICQQVSLPAGVFNLVLGQAEKIVPLWQQDPRVRKLSFTGSTRVGKILAQGAAQHLQRLSLELGGNAAFLVFPSAAIEQAVEAAFYSKIRNAGQTCIASNRFLVARERLNEFVDKLAAKLANLRLGRGTDPEADMGPLIHAQAVNKYQSFVTELKNRSRWYQEFGQLPNLPGYFVRPALAVAATEDLSCFREEIFGPLAVVYAFDTEEDAIRMANSTEAGLAAYLFSQDSQQCQRVARDLEFGMLGMNTARISSPKMAFGGIKQSGYGREGSELGLRDDQNIQYRLTRR